MNKKKKGRGRETLRGISSLPEVPSMLLRVPEAMAASRCTTNSNPSALTSLTYSSFILKVDNLCCESVGQFVSHSAMPSAKGMAHTKQVSTHMARITMADGWGLGREAQGGWKGRGVGRERA